MKIILAVLLMSFSRMLMAAPPVITSFTPSSGPAGTLVTINGTDLSDPVTFTIGGVNAIVISNTGTKLVGMVMPGAVTGPVTLNTADGIVTGSNFTVTNPPVPNTQQGNKLAGSTRAQQGFSVALSADGKTALLGAPTGIGSASVYVFNGTTWTQQTTLGELNDAVLQARQGYSVALSADGNTAIVGGASSVSILGAIWIYVRTGNTWNLQSKMTGTGSTTYSQMGLSVAVSADGNTVITGGPNDDNIRGAVWVFTRNGSTWTQQGNKLLKPGTATSSFFGCSVSLSADGNTALIGGYLDNISQGAAWVFTRSAGNWTSQSKLVGTGNTGAARQGNSVSLSADGNKAIVGGSADNNNQGAAWIYSRNGNTWTQEGSKLVGTGNTGAALQGISVSMNAAGNRAIIGGHGDDGSIGAAWTFAENGNGWQQQDVKLTGTDTTGASLQGRSVAISADGSTVLAGAPGDDSNLGATWVYTYISHNARLSSLTVSDGTLSQAFDSAVISYKDTVDYYISNITVTPVLADSTATMLIQINGTATSAAAPLPLNEGSNIIDIKITAPDGTTIRTYTIAVVRASKLQVISFPSLSNRTYGDADFMLTAIGGFSRNPVIYTSSNPAVATINGNTVTIISEGVTTITAKQAGNALYDPAQDVMQSLTIDRKIIHVTADAISKTYGDAEPSLTYTFTPALITGDNFAGALRRYSGENARTYDIIGDNLTLTRNYSVDYTGAKMTILPKTITVTADAVNKTYGDTDPLLTYTSTPLMPGDKMTGSISRTAGENVGTYALNKNTLSLSSNYTLNFVSADLTITTKKLTVTADAVSKIYGETDPLFTYTTTPLIQGDHFTGSLSRDPGENTGTYSVNKNTLSPGSNYTLNFVSADLTIHPKTITVTADAVSKTYGDADPSLTYTSTPLITGDQFTGSLGRDAGEHVGTYPINKHSLSLNSNYVMNYVPADLTIGTKTVTVTADAVSKTYGDADPSFTYTSTPLIAGNQFTGTLERVPGENAGKYAVNMSSLSLSTNYTLNYISADLTIDPKPVTVTADAIHKDYGDADPDLTYTVVPALVAGDHFTGFMDRPTGETVGIYGIDYNTLALNSNYIMNFIGADFTIGKKTIRVTADALHKTYGDNDPLLTYTIVPALAPGDSFTGSLERSSGEDAGTYAIDQHTLSLRADYILNYQTSDFVIDKRSLTITADNKHKEYGESNPALSVSYKGFAGAENETVLTAPVQLSTSTTIDSPPGDYPITVSNASALNYNITFAEGVLRVATIPQQINFTALADKLSTDEAFTLTATATSGLGVSYTSSDASIASIINNNQVEILKAGTVTITASQPGDAMYAAATAVNQQLIILDNSPPVIVIVSDKGNHISKGETAVLTASGAVTYQWDAGNSGATLSVRPSVTTTYTVTGANQYGRTSTQTFTLEVKVDLKLLVATNIVTPNGDGINDRWLIQHIDLYPNNEVTIFDRRGKIIYTKKGYDNSWGDPSLPDDTYYYVISIDGAGTKKGFITVVK